jgi:cell division protease FtsH
MTDDDIVDAMLDSLGDTPVDDDAQKRKTPPAVIDVSPHRLAGQLALKRGLPRSLRSRLLRPTPTALIVIVPTSDWCASIQRAMFSMLGNGLEIDYSATPADLWKGRSQVLYYIRTAPDRMGRPDMSGSCVPTALANGGVVIGIAADTTLLPAEILLAADATITLLSLRGTDVEAIIRATTGSRRCPRIPDGLVAGLGPAQIAMAVRKGLTPSACIVKLAEISSRMTTVIVDDDVPTLDQAVGYGDAQAWGLSLRSDIDRRRADPSSVPIDTITRSLLLAGPPGVGKTYFARVLAKTCKIPLIATSYGDFQSAGTGHLGDVTRAIRRAFDDARNAANASGGCGAILLIDELDSVPGRHVSQGDQHASWWASIQNLLLTLSEKGAPARRGVILIGATNYVHKIDPAFTRSGRLHPTIMLAPYLTAADFATVLRFHLGDDLPTVDLATLASVARGMTGADAARNVRDARQVARDASRDLVADDLVHQILPPETRPPALLRRLALHEAAHAVIGVALAIMRLDIVTLCSPEAAGLARFEDPIAVERTRAYFEAAVIMKLAGRAADELFGEADSGSGGGQGSDLGDATSVVASLHRSFGLGEGLLTLGSPAVVIDTLRIDPAFQQIVERDLQGLNARASTLVKMHHAEILAVAEALLIDRVLSGPQVEAIIAKSRGLVRDGGTDAK